MSQLQNFAMKDSGNMLTSTGTTLSTVFLVVAALALVGTLVFGIFSLLDTAKATRAYDESTRRWIFDTYGLELSKGKVRALGKGRTQATDATVWRLVTLEGYKEGVQITHGRQYGYRLMTTKDGQASQLPRARATRVAG